jgi:hypothetical protein
MALEDRIRTSVDAELTELSARLDRDLRATVERLVAVALEAGEAVEIEKRVRAGLEEAVAQARADERAKAAKLLQDSVSDAHVREREAEMAALTRLLESIRGLDAASSLSDVLDALGHAAGREASRAAVLVVRNDRLLGWRLSGFGSRDTQPKAIDLGLDDSGVIGVAVSTARPVTTRDNHANPHAPDFAHLPADRMGFAVPVIVGGRAVAVVYADSVTTDKEEHVVPSGWPEVIELLARHAARCLEALTVQKTAMTQSQRFWVPSGARQATGAGTTPASPVSERSTMNTESDAPPGVNA